MKMKPALRFFSIGLILLLFLFPTRATAADPPFPKDATVVFLGDSIFHGGKIHSNLLLFQATRHPDAPITMINAGVSGDMTSGAVRRLEWDVLAHQPTHVVLMFGMNDVGRWLFGAGKDTPANIAQRDRMFQSHVQNRDRILQALRDASIRVILCTPTPFDQYTKSSTDPVTGVDDALAKVARSLQTYARANDLPVVDFHKQMLEVLHAQQKKNPAFTMMDSARIHPTPAGHLLMTYIFLKDQKASPIVSDAQLDFASAKVVSAENCTVSNLQKTNNGLSFELLAGSLPYPIDPKEKDVLKWVPFEDDLNREVLRVTHLPAGRYDLLIDNQKVGTFSSADLQKGINLATNADTPQYKQAAAAMALNEKRRARENATLRVFAALEHDVLRDQNVDTTDMNAVRAAMEKAIEEETAKKSWRVSYFTNLTKAYLAEKPNEAKIRQELADQTREIFRLCQPTVRKYELKKAAGG
jgi:lysophospholipase L1-like esterase